MLVAFALRAYRLDFFSLRGDESFTVLFVQKPFAQMWYETLTVEPNPPLLYLMLRAWIALAGAVDGWKANVIAYEPVVPWATGCGLVEFSR